MFQPKHPSPLDRCRLTTQVNSQLLRQGKRFVLDKCRRPSLSPPSGAGSGPHELSTSVRTVNQAHPRKTRIDRRIPASIFVQPSQSARCMPELTRQCRFRRPVCNNRETPTPFHRWSPVGPLSAAQLPDTTRVHTDRRLTPVGAGCEIMACRIGSGCCGVRRIRAVWNLEGKCRIQICAEPTGAGRHFRGRSNHWEAVWSRRANSASTQPKSRILPAEITGSNGLTCFARIRSQPFICWLSHRASTSDVVSQLQTSSGTANTGRSHNRIRVPGSRRDSWSHNWLRSPTETPERPVCRAK